MVQLRLYAVNIDEVRSLFGANAETAAWMRQVCDVAWFDAVAGEKRGVLDRLGPILHRPIVPQQGPDYPTRDDLERLIDGHFVQPDRMLGSWRLVESCVKAMAYGTHQHAMAAGDLDAADFELASHGLSSGYCLGALLRLDPALPLRPLPGMTIGYVPHARALHMSQALDPFANQAPEWVVEIDRWLAQYGAWADDAQTQGRPAPGLLAMSLP